MEHLKYAIIGSEVMKMKGSITTLMIEGRRIDLYLPPQPLLKEDCLTAFVGDGGALFELAPTILPALEEKMAEANEGLIIAGMYTDTRDADYTPWPAKGFDSSYPDFPGQADQYIHWMESRLLPALSAEHPISALPERRCIVRYSLSGLLATYLPFVSPSFGWSASISGSNWYPGFVEYLTEHIPKNPNCRFFLSYGRAEGAGKYSMYRDAGKMAQTVTAALSARCGAEQVQLISDNGKHHNKRVSRFTTVLRWFLSGGQLPK